MESRVRERVEKAEEKRDRIQALNEQWIAEQDAETQSLYRPDIENRVFYKIGDTPEPAPPCIKFLIKHSWRLKFGISGTC